ncbi:hypothetical protein L9F63_013193, partial [Diploptera punctata]
YRVLKQILMLPWYCVSKLVKLCLRNIMRALLFILGGFAQMHNLRCFMCSEVCLMASMLILDESLDTKKSKLVQGLRVLMQLEIQRPRLLSPKNKQERPVNRTRRNYPSNWRLSNLFS